MCGPIVIKAKMCGPIVIKFVFSSVAYLIDVHFADLLLNNLDQACDSSGYNEKRHNRQENWTEELNQLSTGDEKHRNNYKEFELGKKTTEGH